MKFASIFTLLLVIFVAYSSAQRCPGRPGRPECSGVSGVGNRGPNCAPTDMFYFDTVTGQCREMRYLGCGGNSNRHCTRAECEQACRR